MNAAAIPVPQLACLLADTAAGSPADLAAVELITLHGHFLHLPGFRRVIAGAGGPAAVIRWKAALYALETGRLPCTGSEQAVLRVAASLGDDDIPVPCAATSAASTAATSPWSPARSPAQTAS